MLSALLKSKPVELGGPVTSSHLAFTSMGEKSKDSILQLIVY
jgi:hypothetical protein